VGAWRILGGVCLAAVLVAACDVSSYIAVPEAGEPEPRRAGGDAWAAAADHHRGAVGKVFVYDCPPNGIFQAIWGNFTYTDDSSVCTAAVHLGVIRHDIGGSVRILIQPGLASYSGAAQNGVRSDSWGTWDGSFVIVGAFPRLEG
jgi:hypothetical protein